MTEDDWDLIKFFLLCMAVFVLVIVPIGLIEDYLREIRDLSDALFKIIQK